MLCSNVVDCWCMIPRADIRPLLKSSYVLLGMVTVMRMISALVSEAGPVLAL